MGQIVCQWQSKFLILNEDKDSPIFFSHIPPFTLRIYANQSHKLTFKEKLYQYTFCINALPVLTIVASPLGQQKVAQETPGYHQPFLLKMLQQYPEQREK